MQYGSVLSQRVKLCYSPKEGCSFFCGQPSKILGKLWGVAFFTLLLIDNGDLLLKLKCFKLYLRKLHLIMPLFQGWGINCAKWYLNPSMNCMNFIWPIHHGAFAGSRKKKWANAWAAWGSGDSEKGELGMLRIDRAMFTLILASVFVIMAYLI